MTFDRVTAGCGSSVCVAAPRLARGHGARLLLRKRGPAQLLITGETRAALVPA